MSVSSPARGVVAPILVMVVCLIAASWTAAQSVEGISAGGAQTAPIVIEGPPPPVPPAVVARDSEGRVTVRAIRLEAPLQVDGRLDDEIYQLVPALADFVQLEPEEGVLETERTEAWVFFDSRGIYIAVRCWDSQPDRMVANELRRDNAGIHENDNIAVAIDTFYDRRTGFLFQTNPLGALRDGVIPNERVIDDSWNTVWDVKSRRFEQGWTTEIAIPFKSLRYNEGRTQIWGFNIRRNLRWKNETTYLNPVSRSYGQAGIAVLSTAGTLVGVEPPSTSRNLELKPYALSELTTSREAVPPVSNELAGDVGFDVKYGLTRSLIFDFTYNTDFAQVEADEEQVNLTRFNLRFPEKRDFFLEGAGIFSFGRQREWGGSDAPILFFSRTIGLSSGQAVPIQAGGRLTGRVGRYSVGAVSIQTDDAPAGNARATTFSVVRVKRDVLRRSSIGILATNRSRSVDGVGSNQAVGIDAALRFYDNVEVNGYYARTRTRSLTGNAASYQGHFGYSVDKYGVQLEHMTVGEAFNPEIGFLRRENFRRNSVDARFSPRPASIDLVRQFHFEGGFERFTDNWGRLESREARASLRVDFENSDTVNITFASAYEFLPAPFTIARDVVLPVGGYRFQGLRSAYRLGPQRRVTGWLNFERGSFYSGDRTEAGYNGRVEVTPQASLEPRISFDWVDLPEGRFTATLLSVRGTYTFTPRTFLGALVQYNSSNSSFTTNVRFRWEYTPGSDLYIVFSEGRNTLEGPFEGLANRGVAIKLTRLFRF